MALEAVAPSAPAPVTEVAVEAAQPVVVEAMAEVAPTPGVVEPVVTTVEIAQADAAEVVAAPSETVIDEVAHSSPADQAASRAEQLRGLFDTARQDSANAPLPKQDDAAEEVTRNA